MLKPERSLPVLLVERLPGSDCESFIAYLEGRSRDARKAGSILLGISLLVGVVWLGSRVPPRQLCLIAYLRSRAKREVDGAPR